MPYPPKSRQLGFSLVGLLLVSTLASASLMMVTRHLGVTMKTERSVASSIDLTEMSLLMRMILETRESCRKSGLIGLEVDPANPAATQVSLSLPGATGPGPVVLAAAGPSFGIRGVKTLRFTSLVPESPLQPNPYFATLSMETLVEGGPSLNLRNPSKNAFLRLVLDPLNRITDCYMTLGSGGARNDYILIVDEKPANSHGGLFLGSAWRTRDLNTARADTGNNIVDLSGNRFTFRPGTYRCLIKAPADTNVHEHRAKLVNVTNGTDVAFGTSGHSHGSTSTSDIHTQFTILADTTFEVQHHCMFPDGSSNWFEGNPPNSGFGLGGGGFAVNTYTVVDCTRVD